MLDVVVALIRHPGEQIADQVQARRALVVGLDDVPGTRVGVGVGEHAVLGLGVVDPAGAGLEVRGAELPALARV